MALGSLKEPVEKDNIWCEQVLRRVNAALGVGKKRPLKMDTDRAGLRFGGRLRDEPGEAGECAQCGIEGSGDGGGQIAAGAALGQEAADCGDGLGGGFHDVVTG